MKPAGTAQAATTEVNRQVVADAHARYRRSCSIRLGSILATWRSGYAAACKAVYTGSIPVVASKKITSSEATFPT